jgi:Type I phosphodiesterase / nucleotide pyrophosphatase
MKSIWATALMMIMLQPMYRQGSRNPFPEKKIPEAKNLIVITIDGFRWQELFNGADPAIINSEKFTPDTSTTKLLYWDPSVEERRKKLLPFFWNVIAKKGQLLGNRQYDNNVNVANLYSLSYPGYNEMFTGTTDITISSNRKIMNPNSNVFEYLQGKEAFKGSVAIFSSWDVFPYILNTERNNLQVNSGYQNLESNSLQQQIINAVQSAAVYDKTATRHDQLTFLTAKEYIRQHKPRLTYISLGETDEFAHQGRYDLYLQQAAQVDKMIGELWHWVQTTPGYKNNTTFIITTDHGRGSKPSRWTSHGEFITGSSQTWFAIMGPGITPFGEVKEKQQYYQQQLAQTIAYVLGENFSKAEAAPLLLR